MLYLIGAIALLIIVYGLILFFKRGNKEFEAKLSLREKTELEKILEKQVNEEQAVDKKVPEKEIPVEVQKSEDLFPKEELIFPSKDINAEINRYASYIDFNNLKVEFNKERCRKF